MSTDDLRNPSEIRDEYWIYQRGPPPFENGEVLGKWLVFDHVSKIDNTWKQIRDNVASGELHAVVAKVSTAKPNPIAANRNIKVICVYTTEQCMDEVGLRLIRLPCVQRMIHYKTDEATLSGLYLSRGHGKVTCRTLEWNMGNPAFKG